MRVHSQSSLESNINVTPLVDVCLVLLIIFMVVMPTIINGVPVKLPAASHSDSGVPTKPAEDSEEDRADLLVVEGALLAGALGDEAVADHRLRRAEERRRHRRVAQLRRERPVALAAADQHEQQVLELHEALRQKDLVRRAADAAAFEDQRV